MGGCAVLALGACAGVAGAAQPTEIATWSQPAGIAPELVFVTDLDGFELATQSVGITAGDGMSAAYVRGAGIVMLTTWRDPDPSAVPCAELPDSPQAAPRCSVERGDAHILLEGQDVDPATLRAAGEAVRVPRANELAHLFSDVPVPGPPVERGDLPPAGDGAPLDPPAAGG
jgi:hypothetical protein